MLNSECVSGVCTNGACYASDVCKALKHDAATPFDENKVNIVFVGSAFTDLATWRTELDKVYEVFDSFAPFSSTNDRFNAFYVDALEPQFCDYFCNNIERLLCCDVSKARQLANQCFPTGTNLQTVVVHNDPKYGGAGYRTSNLATTSINPSGPLVAIHELGHSLFELADEYNTGSGTANSPNCDAQSSGCPKWADLIQQGFDVSCNLAGCNGDSFFVGKRSFMQYLNSPIGDVNMRLSCCAYQALTKSVPPYCDPYDFSAGYLLDYCKTNDYQGFGDGSYDPAPLDAAATPSNPGKGKGKYKQTGEKTKVVSVMETKPGSFTSMVFDGPPGLYRRQQLVGDFPNVAVARARGVSQVLRVEITYATGPPTILLMDPAVEVDVPPRADGGQMAGEAETLVAADVVDVVVEGDPVSVSVTAIST